MKLSLLLVLGAIGSVAAATPVEGSEVAKRSAEDDILDLSYLNSLSDFFLPNFFPSAFLSHRRLFGFDSDALRRSSPRYEIVHDRDKVEVTLEVPGYKFHEIEVRLKAGGRVLSISGEREEAREEDDGRATTVASSFQQSFTLDPGVEVDKITANLADGVLVVTAPRQESSPGDRMVPVTQFDQEALEEMRREAQEKLVEDTPAAEK